MGKAERRSYVLKLNLARNSKNGNAIESIFELHYFYAN